MRKSLVVALVALTAGVLVLQPSGVSANGHDFAERLAASVYRILFGAAAPAPATPHVVTSGVQGSWMGPRRSSVMSYTVSRLGPVTTVGMFSVDWSNSDVSDYLAGGYWIRHNPALPGLQAQAFVSGPELNAHNPPALPLTGTAKYQGRASGVYAVTYGTDAVSGGSKEIGEFSGSSDLTANFGSGTITGCVGCTDPIRISGTYQDRQTGRQFTFSDYETAYRLGLGSVSFNRRTATFGGSNVTLSYPGVSLTSTGKWSGQFSNRLSANGRPRLVGGTFRGDATTTGNTKASFVGAFAAVGKSR